MTGSAHVFRWKSKSVFSIWEKTGVIQITFIAQALSSLSIRELLPENHLKSVSLVIVLLLSGSEGKRAMLGDGGSLSHWFPWAQKYLCDMPKSPSFSGWFGEVGAIYQWREAVGQLVSQILKILCHSHSWIDELKFSFFGLFYSKSHLFLDELGWKKE